MSTVDSHPVFVPNGESRKETAILLVGTAEEFGVSQNDVKASNGGFFITEALADILDGAGQPDAVEPEAGEPEKTSTTKKTSGDRAAKTQSTTQKE